MNSVKQLTQRVNHVMQQSINDKKIVGSVVIVAKQGEVIYQQACGDADRENKIKMDLNSIFLLSSVTKPIITAAALSLIEQKQLVLDAPVTNYLPNFKPKLANRNTPDITIHQLLTHSSGLSYRFAEPFGKGPYNTLQISDGFDDINISLDENLKRLSQAPLLFEPGQGWMYSLSLDVLGAAISAAAGQSLPDLISTLITEPLAMNTTAFTVNHPEQLVTHYRDATPEPKPLGDFCQMQLPEDWNNGILTYAPKRIFNALDYPSGGAGMASSAPDFMRFLLALTQKQHPTLPPELILKMNQLYIGMDIQAQGPGWGFGYGGAVLGDPILAQTPQGKGTIQWGGVYGHNWFYDQVNELAVVAFTNTAVEGMSGLYPTQIRNAVYGVSF